MTNKEPWVSVEGVVTELRKQSAGWGFVTDESIKMFEEQFVIPILTARDAAIKDHFKKLITDEIAQAHLEGSPTMRLTALWNKVDGI